MQLDLTKDQAAELWMILALRIDQLNRDINTHRIDEVRAISARQLGRTEPIYRALNSYINQTA
jgi:hypothetical protein